MRLILVHIVNFVIFAILVSVYEGLNADADRIEKKSPDDYQDSLTYQKEIFYINFTETLVLLCDAYMLLFLLILAYRFAKNSTQMNVKDPILEEEVPLAVYV